MSLWMSGKRSLGKELLWNQDGKSDHVGRNRARVLYSGDGLVDALHSTWIP